MSAAPPRSGSLYSVPRCRSVGRERAPNLSPCDTWKRKTGSFQKKNVDVIIQSEVNLEDFEGAFSTPGPDGKSAKDHVDESYNGDR